MSIPKFKKFNDQSEYMYYNEIMRYKKTVNKIGSQRDNCKRYGK